MGLRIEVHSSLLSALELVTNAGDDFVSLRLIARHCKTRFRDAHLLPDSNEEFTV